MPIISIDVNAPGMSGVKPKAIFIDTNDTASDVLETGYLDHIVAQGVPISTSEMALVTTRPSPNSSDITTAWYGITFSNGQWSLVSSSGSSVLNRVSVLVSSAEFKNLFGTPKLILAAQGANTLIVANTLQFEYHYGTTQYANGGEVYTGYGDSTTVSLNGISAANFTFQTADAIITGPMYTQLQEYYFPTTAINSAIYLKVETGDFTDGDGDFVVHMSYEVVNTSF